MRAAGKDACATRSPQLADLRDSGRIEEDTNRVIFLHRPNRNRITGLAQDTSQSVSEMPPYYIDVIQAKGRNHGTSSTCLSFDRQTATFRAFAR
ncbi:DnaB-like helicase C-terminal domain-containing protein [Termitidicoccus mucosus]|uniref:DnaB-like helicase C-terminal domain-containing protein n=1 Tax=Termitidicoccus mucosus TaxID=1184151 RepID=UPI0009FC8750